jgi:hypothetical protein
MEVKLILEIIRFRHNILRFLTLFDFDTRPDLIKNHKNRSLVNFGHTNVTYKNTVKSEKTCQLTSIAQF